MQKPVITVPESAPPTELVVIDGSTTIRRHRADLQAGAAYHRLAAGLTGGR